MDEFLIFASVALIYFAVLAVICAIELARLAWTEPRIGAATERAYAALSAALGASIGGLLGLNRIFGWGLDNNVAIGSLVVSVALVGFPSVVWLYRYRRDLLLRGVLISTVVALFAAAWLVKGE